MESSNSGNYMDGWWNYDWATNTYKRYNSLADATQGANTSWSFTWPQHQQGWECPKCHRVNSPATSQCYCSPFFHPSCAVCQSESELIAHGTKHICRRCNLRLIDEAISETEKRLADSH
jgi:DNA-directed RNA polymerase subunit RPC12/RpoP